MSWNPKTYFTSTGYRKHVERIGYESIAPGGQFVHRVDGKEYRPYWWTDGHIYVAWESGIPRQTVEMITQAVDERMQECWGMRFKFTMFGDHWSFAEQLAYRNGSGSARRETTFLVSYG